ncbi:MAG: hypothetical protein JWN30_2387 [Bacilli bacterium]|nr:hypothetical protein [Bacilli bacterium]
MRLNRISCVFTALIINCLLTAGLCSSAAAGGAGVQPIPSHYWGKIQGVLFQGPTEAIQIEHDQLVDLSVLSQFSGIKAETRDQEVVYKYNRHTLDVQPGRRSALLNGRVVLLSHEPVARGGYLLVPFHQTMDMLGVPHQDQGEAVNLLVESDAWKQIRYMKTLTDDGKSTLGFIGFLDAGRYFFATKPVVTGKAEGYGALFEGRWAAPGRVTVTKIRPFTDTSSSIYMENLPNGNVLQNLYLDERPEVMIVESCSCAGRYNYATMFTVTEMGLTSIWHSQYSYDRIERSGKNWELVSYRRETIPDRHAGSLPYWEVRETWTGNQFSIVKEVYHAPVK